MQTLHMQGAVSSLSAPLIPAAYSNMDSQLSIIYLCLLIWMIILSWDERTLSCINGAVLSPQTPPPQSQMGNKQLCPVSLCSSLLCDCNTDTFALEAESGRRGSLGVMLERVDAALGSEWVTPCSAHCPGPVPLSQSVPCSVM